MSAVPVRFPLEILLIDDDQEVLDQCVQILPKDIKGHVVHWEACVSFEVAGGLLQRRRYDMVFTDVYRDRNGAKKGVTEVDNAARTVVDGIRMLRFCPVVLFSDGPKPEAIVNEPFVRFVDKSDPKFHANLSDQLVHFLGTGLIQGIRQLHAELDRSTGSYIWGFIDKNWKELSAMNGFSDDVLRRLMRRRAATQLSRLEENASLRDRETSDTFDYYTYPTPAGPLLLGEVLRSKSTNQFSVLLTPHCYLVPQKQKGTEVLKPKADFVLLAHCEGAADVIGREWKSDHAGAVRIPTTVGKPVGRYCYLPAFLNIPDMYCDLMRITSVPTETIVNDYDRIAVIDPPFAEGIQASLGKLYSSVGLRDLRPEDFSHLFPKNKI